MQIEVVNPPAEEPVTLAEAKNHLRVDVTTDDTEISRLIHAAREWAEQFTRRAIVKQTWKLWFDTFPLWEMRLPGGKVQILTSVEYIDTAGVLQTVALDDCTLISRTHDAIARLTPAYGKSWPGCRDHPESVRVQYEVGYGNASAVPADIKQAVLLHVGWHYENREAPTPANYLRALELKLSDFRLFEFA